MSTPTTKAEYKITPNNTLDQTSERKQCAPRSQRLEPTEMESIRSNATHTPAHRFGFDLNDKTTNVSYQYQNDVAVGFSVSTDFLIGLFK